MLFIGSDHAGWKFKENLLKLLKEKLIIYEDLSEPTYDSKDDYPLIAFRLAEKVVGEKAKGVMICGTGTGVVIASNKIKGAHAACLHTKEAVILARLHNDLNILCLSGLEIDPSGKESLIKGDYENLVSMNNKIPSAKKALSLIQVFLETPFEGGRHKRRMDLIKDYEKS